MALGRFASLLLYVSVAAVPASAAQLTTLASFGPFSQGYTPSINWPRGDLIIDAAGSLYGTTYRSGDINGGGVFKITKSGALSVLATFSGRNGPYMHGSLIADKAGTLYGTTINGGTSGEGTVFSLTKSGTLNTLVNFDFNNGRNPTGSLIFDAAGTMYGTTTGGGASWPWGGTVFSLTKSGTLTTLASFNRSNGEFPAGSLIIDAAGTLYGTTRSGGASQLGTVFSLTRSGTLTTLASFDGRNGSGPVGSLIIDSAGTLYGTTYFGGADNAGTVFSLTRSGKLTTLVSFNGFNGLYSAGSNRGRFPCGQAFAKLTSIGSGATAVTPGTAKRSPRNW